MKPMRTIAALSASAALMWGSAQAAPDAPEATEEVPVIILELQPHPGMEGSVGSDQEQALMSMLLLQLLMGGGMQMPAEAGEMPPAGLPAPVSGGQRI